MREIHVDEIIKNIKEMCIEANHYLSEDMELAMRNAVDTEISDLGKQILKQLGENIDIAREEKMCIRDRRLIA